jgi:hypothetical protein
MKQRVKHEPHCIRNHQSDQILLSIAKDEKTTKNEKDLAKKVEEPCKGKVSHDTSCTLAPQQYCFMVGEGPTLEPPRAMVILYYNCSKLARSRLTLYIWRFKATY